MIEPFNLTDDDWIPCVSADGKFGEHNLVSVLSNAHQIRELHPESPLMTPQILRLLLAILHRGWQSESVSARYKEWHAWWHARRFPDQIYKYLEEQRSNFELFDAQKPFYQTANLILIIAKEEDKSVLQLLLNQGNNPTLFNHHTEADPPPFSPAAAARALLVGQAYAAAGPGSRPVEINGVAHARPGHFLQSHLFDVATIWINGASLFETLLFNLCPVEWNPDDGPVWEKSVERQIEEAMVTTRSRTQGPMERLTFQSRLIQLLPTLENGQTVVRRVRIAQGRMRDELNPDEMVAYQTSKKKDSDKSFPVGFDAGKAAWRDAHAIFSLEKTSRRPACFAHSARTIEKMDLSEAQKQEFNGRRLRMSVAGLANQPGKTAKIVLWRHERMPVPVALLSDVDLVAAITIAVEEAEAVADELLVVKKNLKNKVTGGSGRMWKVAEVFCYPNKDEDSESSTKMDAERLGQISESFDPRRAFWPRLEAAFPNFLLDLPSDRRAALEKWRDGVESEATRCFNDARRALGTSPRALRTCVVPDRFLTKARLGAAIIRAKERKANKNKKQEVTL